MQPVVDAMRERGEHEQAQAQPEATRSPSPAPHEPAQRLASSVGNAGFAAFAQQQAGVLPDGRVHPDVEAMIARTRGGGSALDAGARRSVGPALGDPLADVRVHTDDSADALARSVSARAFTTGADVYFASGEYRPGSRDGDRLLAHELAHVVQQRGAPGTGPLTVSEPGDALERDADAVADALDG